MVSSKQPRGKASKVSSSAAPAATSATQTAQKSSILRSCFSPSEFQLLLFASVIQGLDGQHLRIHDVNTGRLRCEHAFSSKATINCLDWGRYGENHSDRQHQESKKKRKRSEKVNGSAPDPKDVVVSVGTSDSDIHLFSPSEAKIVRSLPREHTQGVRDFRFADGGSNGQAWSVGGDGRIIKWNIWTGESIMSLRAPAPSVAKLYPAGKSLLCASHTTYLLDLETKGEPRSYTASSHPIHSIATSKASNTSPSTFLTASEAERTINVFDVGTQRLIGTLIPEAETMCLALSPTTRMAEKTQPNGHVSETKNSPEQSLAAVNKEGTMEIFASPFDFVKAPRTQGPESIKARRKEMIRKATATIRFTRPDNSSVVPILDVSFDDSDIVLAWAEGGVNVLFDRIKWRDESTGRQVVQGTRDIVKAKSGAGIGGAITNSVKDMRKSHVDDSHAVVAHGGDVPLGINPSSAIDISSAEDESESSEEEPNEEDEPLRPEPVSQLTSQDDEDIEMQDAETANAVTREVGEEAEEVEEETEPTFGDLVRANASEAIDVQASFPPQNQQALATTGDRSLQLPSGMSLGTVLTQSLRTNDVNLLESCFHVRDLHTVRATIERIDSSLATTLLQKLAERLHSRPGRAGSLMVWIQWTLVAHGGYLASQPEVMKKLTSLHRVVAERANSLQSLLSLKGKLDMLEAQMNLRKSMQARSRAANALDEDDEEGVIYVEGQEESDSEAEAEVPNVMQSNQQVGQKGIEIAESQEGSAAAESDDEEGQEEDEEDEDDEMPTTTNGFVPDSEDEGSESDDDEGLIDDEAVSTDANSDDAISADEVDHDDVSSVDSEASSEPEDVPPAKRLAKAKLANGSSTKSR